ncbi:ribonuclease III family protein [Holophaga foetida]|uniref:ribonuclease III family protein n=1 Tax=Holophaga foetida TaxID=35839 RepID=UPI00024725CF|nr:ribonuclease III [Holophaga foetida]
MGHARRKGNLEQRLGHAFANHSLLVQALTPPSAGLADDNQRLEFLGDAILQLCVSSLIFAIHPDWREGSMSKLRGMLVCTESLKAWATELGLDLTRGPRSPKKGASTTIPGKPMADAMEALIAAVYLDEEGQGRQGLPAASALVARHFELPVRQAFEGIWAERDSKTTLQETAASRGCPPPTYELLQKSGPDHAPNFLVRVQVAGIEAQGEAPTLKAAQTRAAREALRLLREELH